MLKCPCTVYAKVRLEGLHVVMVVSFGQTTTTGLTVVHPMTAVRYCRKPDIFILKRNGLAAGTK